MSACMGGFCPVRDRCASYVSGRSEEPAERLCRYGKEQPAMILRGHIVRQGNEAQRVAEKRP